MELSRSNNIQRYVTQLALNSIVVKLMLPIVGKQWFIVEHSLPKDGRQ
jgi:hypothetical protein